MFRAFEDAFGTPEARFLHRISLPYRRSLFLHRVYLKTRRVHQEPFFRTECVFRTPEAPLLYRISQK